MLNCSWLDEKAIQKVGLKNTIFLYKVIALLVVVIILLSTRHIPPLKRQFFERDPTISFYNYDDKDICNGACLIGCGLGISFTVIFATSFIYNKLSFDSEGLYFGHKKWEIWVSHMIGLGYATITTAIVTNILKATVARPRPAFFYLCNYKGYYDAVHSGNFTSYNANTTPNAIGDYNSCLNFSNDNIFSFPSGHSSFSFACMTFTVYVLQRTLKTDNGFSILGMLCYSPLIVSLWIAVTRVHDFKHHEDDIFAGAFIGIVCASLSWYFTAQSYLYSITNDKKEKGENFAALILQNDNP